MLYIIVGKERAFKNSYPNMLYSMNKVLNREVMFFQEIMACKLKQNYYFIRNRIASPNARNNDWLQNHKTPTNIPSLEVPFILTCQDLIHV